MAWPITCSRWLRAKRVKSGMFSETVAQNPTVPLSAGIRNFRKSGRLRSATAPTASGRIRRHSCRPSQQQQSHRQQNRRADALQEPNVFDPLRTTARLMSQNAMKQIAVAPASCAHAGAITPISVLMASPPIQVWMPNHPQATSARRTAATLRPALRTTRAPAPGTECRSAPRMRVQQHRRQHDRVAEKDRGHRLLPVHSSLNQAGGQHVGQNVDRHRHPERGKVVGSPVRRAAWWERGLRCRAGWIRFGSG
jgi:hypothetical protein